MRALLQSWVAERAERCPDAPAVVMQQECLTYAQLEETSNRLARLLKASGCHKGDRVGLLVPKSPTAIVGILGVLKADCIYVPVDIGSPAPRIARIFASCEPRWVLTAAPAVPLLDELWSEEQFRASISIGCLGPEKIAGERFTAGFSWADLQSYASQPLDSQTSQDDAAYILFTSGSTGTPKGVVITHANIIHFVEWAITYFDIGPDERLSGHPPLHFDLSTFDIFGAFAAGSQLHLVPTELNLLPHKLADFIRSAELTQWFSVPSVLSHMAKFDVVQYHDFPTLKRLLWCGEVLPTPVLMYWMKRLPHVTFTNLYGPTEATIASSYYTVPKFPEDERAAIPIGNACEGEELLVLDEHMQPVPQGEIGDLYIRGVGLSPGYWKESELTAAVFRTNPHSADPSDRLYKTGDLARIGDDGYVYFLGRADTQIKSRGYRIELGEIETALHAIDSLRESVVVAIHSKGFEGSNICCAYVPFRHCDVTPITLRKQLSKVLPHYMLPSRWMALDQLPKNQNGKIDRGKLREQFEQNATQTNRYHGSCA